MKNKREENNWKQKENKEMRLAVIKMKKRRKKNIIETLILKRKKMKLRKT